jgi:uncharacterized membrane protein
MKRHYCCTLCRWMDHTLVWRGSYKRVFNPECLVQITKAVQSCEQKSALELCVIAEQTLPYSYLRRKLPVRERAIMLFGKHRVWDTEHNTGLLIYVNMVERSVELVADRGIAKTVSQVQWDTWALQLNESFARDEYQSGLVNVIDSIGDTFAHALPHCSAPRLNTVSDAPIVL